MEDIKLRVIKLVKILSFNGVTYYVT